MLKSLEINGFKSFASKSKLVFDAPISVIVGPNGSGKSNAAEAFRFVLGEQSLKTLRARNSDELLYNGGQDGRRRNRASVKAVFDNTSKQLDIDYSEVVIERIIERGDASTYRINGSQVRLKDVVDLLSDANIGTSRHHIISQGEADRILNINERERKSVIEDALGLRRFYRRRREAIQKLDRTEENLTQVQQRRQDLEPELKFLTRQKNRIEKTKKLREKLTEKYQKFFKREAILFSHKRNELQDKRTDLEEKQISLKESIKETENTVSDLDKQPKETTDDPVKEVEQEIEEISKELSAITESLGEVSGQLQTLQKQQKRYSEREPRITIKNSLFVHHKETFETLLDEARSADSSEQKVGLFTKLQTAIRNFLGDLSEANTGAANIDNSDEIETLKEQQSELKEKRNQLEEKKENLQEKKVAITRTQKEEEQEQHEAEKRLLQLKSQQENITAELERVEEQIKDLTDRKEQLDDERSEARILCGKEALETEEASLVDAGGEEVSPEELIDSNSKRSSREFHRQLERLKIKLEDTRVSDQTEVLNEYERVQEQVSFLEDEMADLRESKQSLLTLIDDIETTVAEKFDEGIGAINKAFSDFFTTMFGGGSAELFITEHPQGKNSKVQDIDEDPDETERGVGINIKLPNKKVRGLGVLSGGERSLVSIALLFALSQINPPPFVVLDEADAALDEANSQRFGDMIDRLSDRSQLIIITHNRETMSRADLLYGVTIDQAGGSRLLSLNFSEAVETVEG